MRQNLALVIGLQGRFQEAETIARGDLSPSEAAANVAYLRQMLAQQNDLKKNQRGSPLAPSTRLLTRAIAGWSGHRRVGAGVLRRHHPDRRRSENDDEQHRQEEQDHRHGELGRQRGRLLLGFRHAHVAVFLRHHAQRLRRAACRSARPAASAMQTDFTPSRSVRLARFS